MSWIRSHLKIVLPVAGGLVVVAAYLAFAVFGVHTLFIDDRVDESGPVFASGASADEAEPSDADVAPATTAAPEVPATNPAPEAVSETTPPPLAEETPATTAPPVTTQAPITTEPAQPEIVTLAEGSFIPRGRYSGEGNAVVLNDGSEQRFLRFENFSTDNGPDLNVYLVNSSADADQGTFDDDFIDLGTLKGNIGDQNYEIPPEVDLQVYDTVVVWCVRFSTAFTAADLGAA